MGEAPSSRKERKSWKFKVRAEISAAVHCGGGHFEVWIHLSRGVW